jgi:hypothetical protein
MRASVVYPESISTANFSPPFLTCVILCESVMYCVMNDEMHVLSLLYLSF